MKNGKYIEYDDEKWYLNGKLHRDDGPASIWYHDAYHVTKKWFYKGKLWAEYFAGISK